MDTPYYEQLQYVGDTRIQALISYTVAGDDRLALQALRAFNDSRSPDGLTRSRYPSSLSQTIPTFSLLYVGMLHDYWMYRPDPEPVRALLPGSRDVLGWFGTHEQPDGLLGTLPWWSFIDWVSSGETPTYDAHGESCITTLEYLGALDDAADLEKALGDAVFATRYHSRAAHVRSGIYSKCWNACTRTHRGQPRPESFQPAGQYPVGPLRRRSQRTDSTKCSARCCRSSPEPPPTASSAPPITSASTSPAPSITPASQTITSSRSTPGANSFRSTSAPGLRFPGTPAPTPTPGRPIPSTTCSLWSQASSRPAPASPRSASLPTWDAQLDHRDLSAPRWQHCSRVPPPGSRIGRQHHLAR